MLANNDRESGTRYSDNNCTSTSDGSRLGYHIPAFGDEYLPNCQNPLLRELWRVFQKKDGSAYMIPRPDGLGNKYHICTNYWSTGAPLNNESIVNKAQKYGLCDDISGLNIDSINSMEPNDALEFSTIFHRQMEFVQDGEFIDPFVPDEDILAACETLRAGKAVLTYCDQIKNRCNLETGFCTEIQIIANQAALDDLIPALNRLYGVRDTGEPCNEQEGATFGCPVAACQEPPEGCAYTSAYAVNSLGDCCKQMCYAVDKDGKKCTTSGGASILSSWIFVMTFLVTLQSLLRR